MNSGPLKFKRQRNGVNELTHIARANVFFILRISSSPYFSDANVRLNAEMEENNKKVPIIIHEA
jgi:hypothetical protein